MASNHKVHANHSACCKRRTKSACPHEVAMRLRKWGAGRARRPVVSVLPLNNSCSPQKAACPLWRGFITSTLLTAGQLIRGCPALGRRSQQQLSNLRVKSRSHGRPAHLHQVAQLQKGGGAAQARLDVNLLLLAGPEGHLCRSSGCTVGRGWWVLGKHECTLWHAACDGVAGSGSEQAVGGWLSHLMRQPRERRASPASDMPLTSSSAMAQEPS